MRDHLPCAGRAELLRAHGRNREVHIGFFLQWCKERGLSEPVEVTRPVLERYQRHLFHYRKKNGEPLSFRSQHSRLVPLRVWFRWMTRQNHILHNPASELELPRLGRSLPKNIFSAQEVERIMQLCEIEPTHRACATGRSWRCCTRPASAAGDDRAEALRPLARPWPDPRRRARARKTAMCPSESGRSHGSKSTSGRPSPARRRAGRHDRVPHGPGRAVQPRPSDLRGEGTDRRGEAGQDRLLPSLPPHDGHADARERGRHPPHPGRCSATRTSRRRRSIPRSPSEPCNKSTPHPSRSDARTRRKPLHKSHEVPTPKPFSKCSPRRPKTTANNHARAFFF
jgi:hypothetical protein